MLSRERKVEDWLLWQQQQQLTRLESQGDVNKPEVLKLVQTLALKHIEGAVYVNHFAVSYSGAVGITSYGKPSLSVITPHDPGIPVRALSSEKDHGSLMWMKMDDKEFAVTVWKDTMVRLWDVETGKHEVVFRVDRDKQKHISLCSIDDRTVAYGGAYPTEDLNDIYILNTDTKPWSLGGVVLVEGVKVIYDMCPLLATDGTQCLLLCCPYEHRVQAVELMGGRIRWKSGQNQMGDGSLPWSICTDGAGLVFVADNHLNKIHLLSAEDGSKILSVNLYRYDIFSPSCMDFRDGEVFVGHVDKNWKMSQISKFEMDLAAFDLGTLETTPK